MVGNDEFSDISLASKLNSMSIKVNSFEPFSFFKYGFTIRNLKSLFFELPLSSINKLKYHLDPYFGHGVRLIMKKELIKDQPLIEVPKQ